MTFFHRSIVPGTHGAKKGDVQLDEGAVVVMEGDVIVQVHGRVRVARGHVNP